MWYTIRKTLSEGERNADAGPDLQRHRHLALVVCIRLASYVMTGNRQTLDEVMAWQTDYYDTSFYQDLERT